MAGDIKQKYGTGNQAITCTLASLADSALAGRASTAIDNSALFFMDALVFVIVKTAGTMAGDKAVYLYAYGTSDGGTNYSDGIGGTDAAFTMTDPPNVRFLGVISTPVTATTYKGGPFSVAAAFGGVLPEKWGIFVRNRSGAALDATEGSHAKFYQGVHGQYT
jgi:hypothetical protein